MKALSIRQPWASLVAHGIKSVENRPRPTKYRGPVLIHASGKLAGNIGVMLSKIGLVNLDRIESVWIESGEPYGPTGAIIGRAEIVDCVRGHDSRWAEPGAWQWVMANAKPLPTPVTYPGRLGLFDAPEPDDSGLYKPHAGGTRRVDARREVPDVMITRPGKWGNPFKVKVSKGRPPQRPLYYVDSKFVAGLKDPCVVHGFFRHGRKAAKLACRLYEQWVREQPELIAALPELKGKRLGCFCPAGAPCHGDVLVRMVEERRR